MPRPKRTDRMYHQAFKKSVPGEIRRMCGNDVRYANEFRKAGWCEQFKKSDDRRECQREVQRAEQAAMRCLSAAHKKEMAQAVRDLRYSGGVSQNLSRWYDKLWNQGGGRVKR